MKYALNLQVDKILTPTVIQVKLEFRVSENQRRWTSPGSPDTSGLFYIHRRKLYEQSTIQSRIQRRSCPSGPGSRLFRSRSFAATWGFHSQSPQMGERCETRQVGGERDILKKAAVGSTRRLLRTLHRSLLLRGLFRVSSRINSTHCLVNIILFF